MKWISLKLSLCLYWLLAIALFFSNVAFANLSCPIIPATGQPACEVSNDVGSSSPDASKVAHVGNPVDVVSGNKYQAGVDVRLGASALSFKRHYNSSLASINIGLGNGWRHSYSVSLIKSGPRSLTIAQSDGRLIHLYKEDEIYRASEESDGYVVDFSEGRYGWYLSDGRQLQFQGSFLVAVLMPDGEQLKLLYHQSRLSSISNQSGQALELEYGVGTLGLPVYGSDEIIGTPPGHLAKIKLPDGTSIEYRYDKNQNLTSVAFPRGSRYTSGVQYRYQDSTNPTLLTERTNAVGNIEGRWIYDESQRVSEYWSHLHVKPDGTARGNPDLSLSYRIGQEGNSGSTHVVTREGEERFYDWQLDDSGAVTSVVEGGIKATAQASNLASEGDPEENQSGEIPFLPYHGNAELTVVSIDEIGYPSLVEYKGEFGVHSSSFATRYDLVGDLLSVEWLSGQLLDSDEQEREYNNATLDALVRTQSPDKPLDMEILSKITQVGHFEASVRSLLSSSADALSVGSQITGTGWVGLNASLAQKSNGPSTYTPKATLRKNAAQGGTCLNPLNSCADLARARDYAELAACVYSNSPCTSHIQEVRPAVLGVSPSVLENGPFRARVYFDSVRNEYIVSFAGTNELADWPDNIEQEFGVLTFQYERAANLARELSANNPGKSFSFTGHSLGGGLATAAASVYGGDAIVFNPASLDSATASAIQGSYSHAQNNTEIYSVLGEALMIAQAGLPFMDLPPGRINWLQPPSLLWIISNINIVGGIISPLAQASLALHTISAVITSIADLRTQRQCPP